MLRCARNDNNNKCHCPACPDNLYIACGVQIPAFAGMTQNVVGMTLNVAGLMLS